MLLYVLKLNQNAKMPEAYGKYYAYPVITQTVDIDGLAEHMASHVFGQTVDVYRLSDDWIGVILAVCLWHLGILI